MRTNEQTYQLVALDGVTDRLKEHPQNPKRGAMSAIHESINVNGWYGAVLAQESTGYILAGNHKYRSAVQQGAESVPVLWLDVDDETALRILLADNQVAALGYIDDNALQAVMDQLPSLEGTGFGLAVQEAEEAAEMAANENRGGDLHIHAEDVPDDDFESQFGVVLICEDAPHQREVYEALQAIRDAGGSPIARTTSRVVAI